MSGDLRHDGDGERDDAGPNDEGDGLLMAWFVFLMVAAALLCLWVGSAIAHEAPLGWSYPFLCCSNQDCRQAAPGEVRETANGYLVVKTGELVPYDDKRIKDSPDGLFHLCQQGGDFDKGRGLCLFAPSRGVLIMWAVTIEFINHAGNHAEVYLPAFTSEAECIWWKDYLWTLFEGVNQAQRLISASCSRVS